MSVNFDRVSGVYDLTRSMPPEMAASVTDQIISQCGLRPGACVLEMGVGTGRIALPLASALPLKYVGIDISEKMMARLREKSPNGVYLVKADVRKPPFRDNSFDAVIAVHIFHLVPEWQKALEESRRVLRPGGVIAVAGEAGNKLFSLAMLSSGIPAEMADRAAGIAARLGIHEKKIGMVGTEEAVEALKGMGASISLPEPIESKMELPVNILLALIRGRAFSGLWETPQDVLDSCAGEMEGLFKDIFGSLDARLPFTRRFEMVRACF